MDLYNSTINEIIELIKGRSPRVWDYDPIKAWRDLGRSELVLERDSAFELGGTYLPASNCTCVTTDKGLIEGDKIYLVGKDLKEIRQDTSFARIAILEVNAISGEDQEAFRTIRDMEFVKYHVHPDGYMMRVSPENQREQVRVAKEAVRRGISFENIGANYITKYKENKLIDKVALIFVTEDKALCKELEKTAGKVNAITLTLNHIMDGLSTDCSICSFKPVCDEVEGLKELHFAKGEAPMNLGKQ